MYFVLDVLFYFDSTKLIKNYLLCKFFSDYFRALLLDFVIFNLITLLLSRLSNTISI